ncbi:MAG: hypothetical protein ACFNVV_05790, partial [Bacteroidota bacterium]
RCLMRTLNKKLMTLACATCLTVGMGAVACADTVDLGYGMYGTEVAHATDTDKVEVSHLPAGVYTVRADGTVAKMIKR